MDASSSLLALEERIERDEERRKQKKTEHKKEEARLVLPAAEALNDGRGGSKHPIRAR